MKLHDGHREDATLSPYHCPVCRGAGMWRRGVHFDHEKICCVTWDPQYVIDFRRYWAAEFVNQFGDGI